MVLVIKKEYPKNPLKSPTIFEKKYKFTRKDKATMLWTYNRARKDPNVVLCYIE